MAHKSVSLLVTALEWFSLISSFLYGSFKYNDAKFKAHFGISFSTIKYVWFYLAKYHNENKLDYKLHPKHLLWVLHWLKTYNTWYLTSSFTRADLKTTQL